MKKIDRIRQLEADGILHSESCPEPNYWHWLVKLPSLLPDDLKQDYEQYGEVRWYSGEDEPYYTLDDLYGR